MPSQPREIAGELASVFRTRPDAGRHFVRLADACQDRVGSQLAHEGAKLPPMNDLRIRRIRVDDNPAVAAIIRTVMPEFGASGPGFAIHDAEVDSMFEAYSGNRSAYFVVCDQVSRVVGGGGVAQLVGGDEDTCELRKMYFLAEARGRGAGRTLLETCLDAARSFNFRRCYLETLTGMDAAQRLYESLGFRRLQAPLGAMPIT